MRADAALDERCGVFSIMTILGKREKDRDIWNDSAWTKRRTQSRRYASWYDGTSIGQSINQRDREEGDLVKRFPLELNMVELMCDLHRDVARGIPDASSPLVVFSVVERDEETSEAAEKIESVINHGIWRESNGAPMQQEALLSMNIYGGAALKLSWEPWNDNLPYRLAVRHIRNPSYIMPIWDPHDPWRALECYYGFEMSPEVAQAKYGVVSADSQPVLYLEHWTREKWSVSVDGKVPTMKWGDAEYELMGDNPWGLVPIYYIPHVRSTDLFGRSQIHGTTELTKDINSKAATLSDIVHAARPGMLWGHDLSNNLRIKRVVHEGKTVTYVLDVGRTRGIQGANPPTLGALPMPAIPESIAGFPQELINLWMMIGRISPSSFGLDDTQSGRITGPAVANRMWTSIAHSTTERINFSRGKTIIDQDIIKILREKTKSRAFSKLGIDSPEIGEMSVQIRQSWPPMIPMDRAVRHEEMISRLKDGGVSIETYLAEMGIDDIEGERKRIEEWLSVLAEIEASKVPEQFGGQSEPRDQGNDQKIRERD